MICQMFDLDVATDEESNWRSGICGTFTESPDAKHMAELHPVEYPAPEEERFQWIKMDKDERFYLEEDPRGVFILAGPAWSPDSGSVAVLERAATTGLRSFHSAAL